MKQKKEYIAPRLVIVKFVIESGYTDSQFRTIPIGTDEESIENYSMHTTWSDGDNFFI
jgi:hypothetical protein